MPKDVVFKTPTDEGEYKYVLVVYDRPGSMLGPGHDMFAVDSIVRNSDDSVSAYRDSDGVNPVVRFHKDFPWFIVAKTEVEFVEAEKPIEPTDEARTPGSNIV